MTWSRSSPTLLNSARPQVGSHLATPGVLPTLRGFLSDVPLGCLGVGDQDQIWKPGKLVAELEIFSSDFFASLTQMSDAFDRARGQK